MIDIGLTGAFLGGLFALVSPCSALLLPSFFAYAFDGFGRLVSRTLLLYVGLAAVLVPLGAGIGAVGSLATLHRGTITMVGGVLLIFFGLLTLLGKGFSFLPSSANRGAGNGGALSVISLGAVYGFAGFCSGPLLGAVLTFAIAGGSPVYGGALMALYALGMALPLLLLALLWDRYELGKKRWLRGREVRIGPLKTHSTSLISGLVFIAIGVLFLFTEGTANLPGLVGVETQFKLQAWAQRVAQSVPDYALVAGVAVVGVLGAAVLRGRRRQDQ